MPSVALVASALGVAYVVHMFLDYRRLLSRIGNFPGFRQLSHPLSLLQTINDRAIGEDALLVGKFKPLEEAGWDAISWVNYFPKAQLTWILADPDAIKEVTSNRTRFVKPVEVYESICLYGSNIVASEGEEWKRHRKITAPAFSERNNRLVWDETVRIVDDLMNDIWQNAPTVTVNDAVDFTIPIAIFVISAAGFGQRATWLENRTPSAGHKMTFKDAVHKLCAELITVMSTPKWAMGLSEKLRTARLSVDEMQQYMTEMIEERRYIHDDTSRSDLFSLLMGALDDGDAKATDRELTGNIFIFLLAGHETTAHTLAFALAYLALYPEAQDYLLREIESVTGGFQRELTYDDIDSLAYTNAVVYEVLRMQPPVVAIPKRCTEDTSLGVSNQRGERTTIPVPEGTIIMLDAMGLHYNPRHWADPHAFKPERFLGDWNRDAFIPFSTGARACIGRRFSETEAAVVLTKILTRYTVKIADDPKFAHETFQQRKERVLACKPGMTTTPAGIPLTFVRRG
ncbi:cytochrome P450 [Peniophora sp. CONT]|nr:cytochrome P450 [Peniophora sp. CONT]